MRLYIFLVLFKYMYEYSPVAKVIHYDCPCNKGVWDL